MSVRNSFNIMREIWNTKFVNEISKKRGIAVVLNPNNRTKYIDYLLSLDGLSHIQEDPKAVYCPISLTSTPDELKPFVAERQKMLSEILNKAGLTAYDPGSAPYSPDHNLSTQPNEIYSVDSGKIVGARYFIGHNILPSSGFGVETQKAVQFNRVAVILMDNKIRVSRMQPHRTIYLQYSDLANQAEVFEKVFQLLQKYEPGIGFNNGVPALLGFGNDGTAVDLEEKVYTTFPQLQYCYDGTVPILKLRAENPHLFYEKTIFKKQP